nr:hypothetical protein [Pandoravirus massiliensis]
MAYLRCRPVLFVYVRARTANGVAFNAKHSAHLSFFCCSTCRTKGLRRGVDIFSSGWLRTCGFWLIGERRKIHNREWVLLRCHWTEMNFVAVSFYKVNGRVLFGFA